MELGSRTLNTLGTNVPTLSSVVGSVALTGVNTPEPNNQGVNSPGLRSRGVNSPDLENQGMNVPISFPDIQVSQIPILDMNSSQGVSSPSNHISDAFRSNPQGVNSPSNDFPNTSGSLPSTNMPTLSVHSSTVTSTRSRPTPWSSRTTIPYTNTVPKMSAAEQTDNYQQQFMGARPKSTNCGLNMAMGQLNQDQ